MKSSFTFLLLMLLLLCTNKKRNELAAMPQLPEFETVAIKGGKFIMGGLDVVTNSGPRDGDLEHGDECPHVVTVNDFSIGKYEVTQREWIDIMGNNPSTFKDNDRNPVENVSWNDVQLFISRLNSKYLTNYRLPTEEEWEFAARGGLQSKNYRYSGSNNANDVAWWASNSYGKTHPVGQLKPNELGLFDMSGNIWEWCADWKIPYVCNSDGQSFVNISRVLRGGTYANDSSSVRVRDRNGRGVTLRIATLGLRLAR